MIFITGANGLVGSFIIRQLLAQGEKIRVLKRKTSDFSLLADVQNQIEYIEGDLLDYSVLNEALKNVNYVIHAAAVVSFDPNDLNKLYETNVEGTANLVNVCLENSITKFCHISSIAAIGRSKEISLINENTKWENSEHNSNYAKTKYLAELEVWRGMEEGLDVVIVNPTIILGPGDWTKSSVQLFKQVWKNPTFYPPGSFHYIDVRDVANITIKLLLSDIKSERFILTTGVISYLDFFKKTAQRFNIKAPKYKIPHFLITYFWRIEKLRSKIFGHKPLVTKETATALTTNFKYDNQKILNFINHEFYSIDDSIQWTCEKLIERYLLQKG